MSGQVTTVTITYTPAWGWVTVQIGPGSIEWQTAWSIDGGTTWLYSRQTATAKAGPQTIIFSDMPGWTKPANLSIEAVKDSSLEEIGTYS